MRLPAATSVVGRVSDRRGQSAMEAAIVMAAVVFAASLMAAYVRGSLRANVKLTEMQLNGAIQDNRP